MSAYSPEKSPRRKARQEGIGKVSAPFLRDTGVIIEKFVDAVKDLFQYCYTDKDLYGEIHKMTDDELFASLSEYLEDIKFGIFEALSQNLDKLSLKFLQVCDKQEHFDKYLKALKDKWRASSSLRALHRHDDRYIRSAKQYVNRLAATDAARSVSANKKEKKRIRPQVHTSEFDSVNSKPAKNRQITGQSISSFQDMPLNESKVGAISVASRSTYTPAYQAPARAVNTVGHETPRKGSSQKPRSSPSPNKKITSPSRKIVSPTREKSLGRSQQKPETESLAKMTVAKTDYGSFVREIIDPQINRTII